MKFDSKCLTRHKIDGQQLKCTVLNTVSASTHKQKLYSKHLAPMLICLHYLHGCHRDKHAFVGGFRKSAQNIIPIESWPGICTWQKHTWY